MTPQSTYDIQDEIHTITVALSWILREKIDAIKQSLVKELFAICKSKPEHDIAVICYCGKVLKIIV